MKTLQNNFTTPEQSKLLLGIGVPADSADCHYLSELDPYVYVSTMPFSVLIGHAGNNKCIPCWSVGRLIEIFEKCTGERFSREIDASTLQLIPLIEDVIAQIEKHLKMIYRRLDLSKLEE